MKRAAVQYVLCVPNLHTSQGLLRPIADDGDLRRPVTPKPGFTSRGL